MFKLQKVKRLLYSICTLLLILLTAMTFTERFMKEIFVWGLKPKMFKKREREKVSSSLGGSLVQAKEKPINQPKKKISNGRKKSQSSSLL